MTRMALDAAPADPDPRDEVALLRSLALAASEAAAAGEALPDPLHGPLDIWLRRGWPSAGDRAADRDFTQGYLAGLEAAARQCADAAEARAAVRRRCWNPWRRHTIRQAEAGLRSMAAGLRLMASGAAAYEH